jgi:hypothetical protein
VEIEVMPYFEAIEPFEVSIDSGWYEPEFPCIYPEDYRVPVPYDVGVTVLNHDDTGINGCVSVPISFGLAQWGFYFPPLAYGGGIAVFDTTVTVCAGEPRQVAPPHFRMPWFEYIMKHDGWYYYWERNIVIDYPVYRHNCFKEDSIETRYVYKCKRTYFPNVPFDEWKPFNVPIPIKNSKPVADTIYVEVSTDPLMTTVGWDIVLHGADNHGTGVLAVYLEAGETHTTYLSVTPTGAAPSVPFNPALITVQARRCFCQPWDYAYLEIEFMPYVGVYLPCIWGACLDWPGQDPILFNPDAEPGKTLCVPVCVQNDVDLTGLEMEVEFAAGIMTVEDVLFNPARTDSLMVDWWEPAPGVVKLMVRSPMDLSAKLRNRYRNVPPNTPPPQCSDDPWPNHPNALTVAQICFAISEETVPCTDTRLSFGDVWATALEPNWGGEAKGPICVNTNEGCICIGGVRSPMKCDVDSSGSITLVDLFMMLYHMVGIAPLTPGTNAYWAADFNNDGIITIVDLMKCIQRATGVSDPKIAGIAVSSPEVAGVPGQVVRVPVELRSELALGGAYFRLSYDPAVMSPLVAVPTVRSERMVVGQRDADGELYVLVYSMTGETISAGTGAMVEVPFRVARGVEGETQIEYGEVIVFTPEAEAYVVDAGPVVLKLDVPVPTEYGLAQNYPNPFNPETTIEYQLPESGDITLVVYNTLGQVVRTLVAEHQEAGYYAVRWDGRNQTGNAVSSGMYFYRLTSDDYSRTMRMVLMK